MRISDWSSDVCSSDLAPLVHDAARDPDNLARTGGRRAPVLRELPSCPPGLCSRDLPNRRFLPPDTEAIRQFSISPHAPGFSPAFRPGWSILLRNDMTNDEKRDSVDVAAAAGRLVAHQG